MLSVLEMLDLRSHVNSGARLLLNRRWMPYACIAIVVLISLSIKQKNSNDIVTQ